LEWHIDIFDRNPCRLGVNGSSLQQPLAAAAAVCKNEVISVMRMHLRILDSRQVSLIQTGDAVQKKFNWCLVTPTILEIEPFGKTVERLSLCGD
jgi:hypothetical protein